MALSLGQILGGAGIVGSRMRQAEEAERVAQQNQLAIEEQNRLAAMKARASQLQFEQLRPVGEAAPMPQFRFPGLMPERQVAAPQQPAGLTTGPTREQVAFEEANVQGPVGRGEPTGVTMTGPAPATLPTLEGVSPAQIKRAQDNYQMRAMRYRDAVIGLERLKAREGVPERMIRNQEALIARELAQVNAASEGLSRIAPAAAPAPAPAPEMRQIPPDVQAQRDVEAARIRAQELGTPARAQSELTRIDNEIKRAKDGEVKTMLRAERERVDAARKMLEGQPAAPAAAPAPAPTVAPQATLAPVAQNLANQVLAATPQLIQTDPTQLSQAMQDTQAFATQQRALLVRQRNDAARLAQIYMQSGTGAGLEQGQKLMAAVGQADLGLAQFDNQMREAMIYMQGMQGLQEFAMANNPSRLVGVWSYFSGAPIGVQPRNDGLFDLFVNGQRSREGLSKDQVQQLAQQSMFQSARDAVAKSAALENELALKQKYGDARVNAMKDIWVALINQQGKIAEEQAKAMQGKLTVDTNTGGAYLQLPEGVFFISKGGMVEVPGVGQIQPIQAQRVPIPGR